MADLAEISPLQGGAAALVALVVVLIFTGRLVPRRVVDDVRADKDARIRDLIAERDTWREAHGTSEEARRIGQEQVGDLMAYAEAADHLLRSLTQLPPREVRRAEMDQVPPPT